MTNEQMCEFIQQGEGDELIPLLWEKTKALCYQLAQRRYVTYKERATACGVELADVRQECYIAFLAALRDYTKEPQTVMFTSFLKYHIKNTINSLIGLRTERQRREPLNNCISLDEQLTGDDENYTLAAIVPDTTATLPFEEIEQSDVARVVREAVDKLQERERAVIEMRYFQNKTLQTIGENMNVTRCRVLQLEEKALKYLRKMQEIIELKNDFYRRTSFVAFKNNGASSVELIAEERERLCKQEKRIIAKGNISLLTVDFLKSKNIEIGGLYGK